MFRRFLFASASLVLLAGCSGGGGSTPAPTPTPAPTNQPPRITSAASVSVLENEALSYQLTASDPEGSALTQSLGGEDAARFLLSGSGQLTFRELPDFEAPLDSNRDNIYNIRLTVSDGTSSTNLDLAVTVVDQADTIQLTRVASGFSDITAVSPAPPFGDLLIGQKAGQVYHLNGGNGAKSLLFTVDEIATDGERGLRGIAAAGDYVSQGQFFVSYIHRSGQLWVRRYQPDGLGGYVGWSTPTVAVPLEGSRNLGGSITYGEMSYLYVFVGDGERASNAQDLHNRSGKILRLAKNPDPYAGVTPVYFIAAPGNPYNGSNGDPYVIASGLRNPSGAFLSDLADGSMVFADQGSGTSDEINILRITQDIAGNFGWPYLEGSTVIASGGPSGSIGPVAELQRAASGRSIQGIVGGSIYTGTQASLRDHYLFADPVGGGVWSVPKSRLVVGESLKLDRIQHRAADLKPDVGTVGRIVAITRSASGVLFLADSAGQVFRIEP
ncbi:PQQ-dependent sugar dehydrogenase [Sandaracinobacter neustonicus]|uniref:PQQ-dependent sugar dehydrogenase n=1 Tax=Sandaracinobacter neustonicus TaxID=1715348 RepID=A0A501XVX5_9SPHN|nr:PQQ-dependent sugar dehydrogenase [Sandaracinobacter neustonicus]TPE64609.1 PQQ-dependent sugar dehydrogenase [Sandaracinobacter neustonicus]